MKFTCLFVLIAAVVSGCGQFKPASSEIKVRKLTVDEANADLNALAGTINALYGPLEFKEARFGYKVSDLIAQAKTEVAAATTDEQVLGAYAGVLAKLRDTHVGMRLPLTGSEVRGYRLGFNVGAFEDKVLVTEVKDELTGEGITKGDEVLSLDGQKILDRLPSVLKYMRLANDLVDRQLVQYAVNPSAIMTELVPKGSTAIVVFARPNGTTYSRELTWKTISVFEGQPINFVKDERNNKLDASLVVHAATDLNQSLGVVEWGARVPRFLTKEVTEKFGVVQVSVSEEFYKKYKLADKKEKPDIYAGLYKVQGKTVLLLRQPGYSERGSKGNNADFMNAYRAVLDQYDDVADVLVIDQTHNTGGSYCEDFARLFLSKEGGGFVQRMNADRKWITDLREWGEEPVDENGGSSSEMQRAYIAMSGKIARAYDQNKSMTDEYLPIIGGRNTIEPDESYSWKKPALALVDEFSASCGDAFPAFMKNNGAMKLFGETTNGAGGNIEEVLQLPNSAAKIRLTRGLFTTYRSDGAYTDDMLVENNGVQPDIRYSHTVKDFREGYVGYVDAFTKAALEQIPALDIVKN